MPTTIRQPSESRVAAHGLPRELADRLTKPIAVFLRVEAAAGAFLLVFAAAAVAIANSPWSHALERVWETPCGFRMGSHEFTRSVREWINDAAMTLFFFVVALELKRALLVGELHKPRVAALSIAGALGGMAVPAGLFLWLQWGGPAASGWGTVMATDTAFVIGCLALLGPRVPESLRLFMLALAIVDDLGAILVVSVGYTNNVSWMALAVAGLGIAVTLAMALLGVRAVPIYCALGVAIWLAVDASGIHATITGIILGLLTPARRWVSDDRLYAILSRVVAHPLTDEASVKTKDRRSLRLAEIAARETLSPAERLEMVLHPWVGFVIMPVFALANAGVLIRWSDYTDSVTVSLIAGLVLGKPLGVLSFCWFAVRSGIASRPAELRWGFIAGGGALAGIGFTMSLFIADLAFPADELARVKLGILSASVLAAVLGMSLLIGTSWNSSTTPRQRELTTQ